MTYQRHLVKPDGRSLYLYSRRPIDPALTAPSPVATPVALSAHLRWHPLRGEWVAYAAHRQDRTFLPPKEFNPLAPMRNPEQPTELPAGDYDVAVLDNLFPALSSHVGPPPQIAHTRTAKADGACEVVVFTQDSETSLGRLPLEHIALVVEVLGERTVELAKRPGIRYVMPFENRGTEVGVTLHHPHGQIYAYPFVPPVAQRELDMQRAYFEEHHTSLIGTMVTNELSDGRRVLFEGPEVAAFVPVCARYPYEVMIAPRRRLPSLAALTPDERLDFARAIKTVLLKFDGLWQRPFPYLMVFHQAPSDEAAHPWAHLHVELYPPYRSRDRLKFLAGTELGAGMFANDRLPEDTARELNEVRVEL